MPMDECCLLLKARLCMTAMRRVLSSDSQMRIQALQIRQARWCV